MSYNKLFKVQMPSRYLGNEINTVNKKWHKNNLHVALAFPDLYEIGVSHFGIQILYSILNNRVNTLAERVFAPSDDMETLIKQDESGLCSLESKTPIKKFDIVGFSLLYELNYTNILNMMLLSKIPLTTKERGDKDLPIIIAGGPCTFNPEPIADFFDALVIGDGEEVILQMVEVWESWFVSKTRNKNDLLQEWSKITGVYVPSFFKPSQLNNSIKYQIAVPKFDTYKNIIKATISDFKKNPIHIKPIIPFGRAVHDKLRIELARGCTRGCRFCQAGIIYRPVRERHPQEVLDTIIKSINTTGYEDVSLLSLSTGDYSCIVLLLERLIEYGIKNNVSVSLPSLRAETLTPEIMKLLKKVRKTGFTIAPEAGSQRLRNVINKNINEKDIINTVKSAFTLGWKTIKLYFMIGLPTECDDDLKAIVDLVKKLNIIRKSINKPTKINVSISTFIPKAHTPFQWVKQISLEASKTKISWLREKLKMEGIRFKWQDPHVSFIEGIFARGDRRISKLLISAYNKGCRFDAWTDHFDFSKWEMVLRELIYDDSSYDYGCLNNPLPWDHIKTGVNKEFLKKEYNKASNQIKTLDCRYSTCQSCGICDFKSINTVLHKEITLNESKIENKSLTSKVHRKITIVFSKMGNAKYFGHLEMVKIFHRGLKRANIPLKYSEGFHPLPKVSFVEALPLGMESINQLMTIVTPIKNLEIHNKIKEELNKQLPKGLRILRYYLSNNKKKLNLNEQCYIIKLKKSKFSKTRLRDFRNNKHLFIEIFNRKKIKVSFDLKLSIKEIELYNNKILKLKINSENHPVIRPIPILQLIFKFERNELDYARIIKI